MTTTCVVTGPVDPVLMYRVGGFVPFKLPIPTRSGLLVMDNNHAVVKSGWSRYRSLRAGRQRLAYLRRIESHTVIPVTARTLFAAILDEVKQFQESGEDRNISGLRMNLPFVPHVGLMIACDLRPSGVVPSGRNCLKPTKSSFSNSLRLAPFLKSQVRKCEAKIIHASPRSMSLL